MSPRDLRLRWLAAGLGPLLGASLLLGCGNNPPPKAQDNWLDNLEKREVEGPPPDLDVDDDDDDDDEQAEAKEPPKPAPVVKPASGRPMIQMGPSTAIEKKTFGATPGAVLKLTGKGGKMVLRIPEYALKGPYNITFKIDDDSRNKKGPVVGSIAFLKLTPGDKLEARAARSTDKTFQVVVPTHDRASLNLAVGAVQTDDQGNEKGKPVWKVYPPSKIEEAFKEVYFELPEIGPVMYIHATSADTTEPAPGG